MASIVGKKRGAATYYYLVESARVDGKPRIVSQEYLGTADELAAAMRGGGLGLPDRTRQKDFGAVAAAWGMLEDLGVAGIIDQTDHIQVRQDRPHRGHIPEPPMLAAHRLPRWIAGQLGHHLLGAAQVLLRDDAWFAVHAGGLDQVIVGLVPPALPHDRRHLWVIHDPGLKVQPRPQLTPY